MPGIDNRTVIALDLTLSWTPALGADEELRLQVYHLYPSAGDDDVLIGQEHVHLTGPSPITVGLEDLAIPITAEGELRFVLRFPFRDTPLGTTQMQAQQDVAVDAEVTTRALQPADLERLDPPHAR